MAPREFNFILRTAINGWVERLTQDKNPITNHAVRKEFCPICSPFGHFGLRVWAVNGRS